MPKFILKISAARDADCANDENIGCLILETSLPEEYIRRQIATAAAKDKIVLLSGEGAVDEAVRLNADGIVADLSRSTNIKKDITALKARLGRRFLGVVCRCRRHEAMLVSENEPDFIIFRIWHEGAEKTGDLAAWYEHFFLLQMAVEPMDDEVAFVDFPADMVILSPERYKKLVAQKQSLE